MLSSYNRNVEPYGCQLNHSKPSIGTAIAPVYIDQVKVYVLVHDFYESSGTTSKGYITKNTTQRNGKRLKGLCVLEYNNMIIMFKFCWLCCGVLIIAHL